MFNDVRALPTFPLARCFYTSEWQGAFLFCFPEQSGISEGSATSREVRQRRFNELRWHPSCSGHDE